MVILIPVAITVAMMLIVFILKKRIVREEDGKKFARIEMIIDIIKFTISVAILLSLNYIYDFDIFNITTRLFDIAILLSIIFVFMGGNHTYQNRKALGAIFSFTLILLVLLMLMFSSVTGMFIENVNTYFILFLKAVISFTAFTWATFTANSGKILNKIKKLFGTIIQSFKERSVNRYEYFLYGILGLLTFTGDYSGIFKPLLSLFGTHEILNRRYTTGIIYIVTGNIILLMQSTLYGQILFTLFSLIGFADLIIKTFKFKK